MGQKAETKTRRTVERRAMEAAAADSKRNGIQPGAVVKLSTGVTLRIARVPPLTMREAAMRIAKPAPPIVEIEEKGRAEENVNDPDYVQALLEYDAAVGLAVADAVLLLGTTVDSVPEGVQRPEDDAWVDDLKLLGIEINAENPRARYLAWLKFYALGSDEDAALALAAPMALAGVQEEEVRAAMDSFRDRTMGRDDLPGEAP